MTLEDCEELAPELDARDGFELACRFASETLPGIFRPDDPALALRLAPNHEVQLRKLLDSLPAELFRADDALGWTYQFWQARRKDEVNRSGVKIGADELPAVTQLFTEDYMVEFLLHNSLGAWWAGKESGRLAPNFETEKQARQAVSLLPKGGLPGIDWTYLRFIREPGRPGPESGRDAPAPFVNPFLDVDVTQNQLPHWQQGEAWIFATWRLADSLPAEKLREWRQEKDAWLIRHPEPRDEATTRDYHARFTQRIEDWLDAGHGTCLLRQPELRQIVTGALAFFDGQRYELGDWVVMPNHVHVLFRPLHNHHLPDIIHSWKSFTAKAINKRTGKTGILWQEDYWDRLVRNERHLEACRRYIAENPAKAGLSENEWSRGVSPRDLNIPGRDGPAPVALHVAVARLLGYRWPRQTGSEFPDCPALEPDGLEDHIDPDGIVCLPPLNREQPAAARLRALLAEGSRGASPRPGRDGPAPDGPAPFDEAALLAATGAKSKTLEDWLRDEFFEQHCKLFHQRPFVWHIWDGRKDGFHVLVNYHRFDHATLQKLTYSYLGVWIRQQDADAKADKPGAAERLGAARALESELENILEGEPPYDLFIRWKPLSEQPLGWNPDLNDGVRLNIRPFLSARDVGKKGAGILRVKPNIKWDMDCGKEPHRDQADFPWFWHDAEPPQDCEGGREFTGHRWNNVHLTLAYKRSRGVPPRNS